MARRGLGGVINGTFLAIGQAITWGMLSDTAPELATLADPDWYVIAWLVLGIGSVAEAIGVGIWLVPVVITVIFAVWYAILRKRVTELPAGPIGGDAPFERPDATAPPVTSSPDSDRRSSRCRHDRSR
jgi:hypothetical protein